MLLYRTIVGSRLYGTNRPDSDYDWMEVYSENMSTHQKIVGNIDTTQISLSNFMLRAGEGAHQMLEAMFAPRTDVDMFYDMRSHFYPDTAKTVNLYRRTINKFGDHKARKKVKAMTTALRMTYNLEELIQKGKFNPKLDGGTIDMLNSLTWDEAFNATQDRMDYLSERYQL